MYITCVMVSCYNVELGCRDYKRDFEAFDFIDRNSKGPGALEVANKVSVMG